MKSKSIQPEIAVTSTPAVNVLGLDQPLNGLHDQRERQHTDGHNVDECADGLRSMVAERVLAGGLPTREDSRIDRNSIVQRIRELMHCVRHDRDAAHASTPFTTFCYKMLPRGTQLQQEETSADNLIARWYCDCVNLHDEGGARSTPAGEVTSYELEDHEGA